MESSSLSSSPASSSRASGAGLCLPVLKHGVTIVDFGSQYSQLISRRCREFHVFADCVDAATLSIEFLEKRQPEAVILSGGPASVYEEGAPHLPEGFWDWQLKTGAAILGICYGMQELIRSFGGEVQGGGKREYGEADIDLTSHEAKGSFLFSALGGHSMTVWMSHGDSATTVPSNFMVTGVSSNGAIAAIEDRDGKIYGLQFHPEVTETQRGLEILERFVKVAAHAPATWRMSSFLDEEVERMQVLVGDELVIGAISGGVDSTVAAALTQRAVGKQFHAFFIDNGLLRAGEVAEVSERLKLNLPDLQLTVVDASKQFLMALEDVEDPEIKRKTIGRLFIEAFEEETKKLCEKRLGKKLNHIAEAKDHGLRPFLLQGTLYPDVIESMSTKGPSHAIKSHHNVGGLPSRMVLRVVEPLRLLYKDEVRQLGREMGLEERCIMRHPFPGPGLAVRIVGPVTRESLALLRAADKIFMEELEDADEYRKIGQAFVVLLPTVKSVGVMGDRRTYQTTCVLRAVKTTDYMTASCYALPSELAQRVSRRIMNEVHGIGRVCLDLSSKPPATIEWE